MSDENQENGTRNGDVPEIELIIKVGPHKKGDYMLGTAGIMGGAHCGQKIELGDA